MHFGSAAKADAGSPHSTDRALHRSITTRCGYRTGGRDSLPILCLGSATNSRAPRQIFRTRCFMAVNSRRVLIAALGGGVVWMIWTLLNEMVAEKYYVVEQAAGLLLREP